MAKAIEGLRKLQSRAVMSVCSDERGFTAKIGGMRVRVLFSERENAPSVDDALVNILKRRMR